MEWPADRNAALARLAQFAPQMGRRYSNRRNHDEGLTRNNVSQLSPCLHAGVVSEAEVLESALGHHGPEAADKFIAEVFWRIYFKGYLEQRLSIWKAYCKQRDLSFAELETNKGLRAAYDKAVTGSTGIAAFDHWARELATTGYLHNHARMWFASIWIFTLKLDWALGADFFLQHLLDGDAASNTLSWRWVGGLHTKGKIYLARPDNVERYTQDHPDGPLQTERLATEASPLEELEDHPRQLLNLPAPAESLERPFALLLHDHGASHVPLHLPEAPSVVISAARPEARSPVACGGLTATFARDVARKGGKDAAKAFGCNHKEWNEGNSLSGILKETGVQNVVTPYLTAGWTRDALWPELMQLDEQGHLTQLVSELDRVTWPHAKAGFFGVKKIMHKAMREAGVAPRQMELFDA